MREKLTWSEKILGRQPLNSKNENQVAAPYNLHQFILSQLFNMTLRITYCIHFSTFKYAVRFQKSFVYYAYTILE